MADEETPQPPPDKALAEYVLEAAERSVAGTVKAQEKAAAAVEAADEAHAEAVANRDAAQEYLDSFDDDHEDVVGPDSTTVDAEPALGETAEV